MTTIFRIIGIGFAIIVALAGQLMVVAQAMAVTGNGEWSPLQLVIPLIDGLFIADFIRIWRKRDLTLIIMRTILYTIIVFCVGAATLFLCHYIRNKA